MKNFDRKENNKAEAFSQAWKLTVSKRPFINKCEKGTTVEFKLISPESVMTENKKLLDRL